MIWDQSQQQLPLSLTLLSSIHACPNLSFIRSIISGREDGLSCTTQRVGTHLIKVWQRILCAFLDNKCPFRSKCSYIIGPISLWVYLYAFFRSLKSIWVYFSPVIRNPRPSYLDLELRVATQSPFHNQYRSLVLVMDWIPFSFPFHQSLVLLVFRHDS